MLVRFTTPPLSHSVCPESVLVLFVRKNGNLHQICPSHSRRGHALRAPVVAREVFDRSRRSVLVASEPFDACGASCSCWHGAPTAVPRTPGRHFSHSIEAPVPRHHMKEHEKRRGQQYMFKKLICIRTSPQKSTAKVITSVVWGFFMRLGGSASALTDQKRIIRVAHLLKLFRSSLLY